MDKEDKKKPEEIEETELLEEELDKTELLEASPLVEETTIKPLFKAFLLCIEGPLLGRKFPLRFDITKIGRSEDYNDIVLEGDRKASRRHATIINKGGEYVIYDKRSRNRTYVNRMKLKEDDQIVLKSGDEIEIGSNIFRFIKEGEDDFSPPRKAGSFWLRWKIKMLRISSAAVIMILAYFGYNCLNEIGIITQKPVPLVVKSLNKIGTKLRISEDFNRYYSSLVMTEVSKYNNGIVFCESTTIKILNGRDFSKIIEIPNELFDSKKGITVVDIDQNGVKDLIVLTNDSKVESYDCSKGLLIWQTDFLGGNLFTPLVEDLNNDREFDLVVVSREGKVNLGYLLSGKFEFKCYNTGDTLVSSGVIGDLDNDGRREVIVVSRSGQIYIIDGLSGELKDRINVLDKLLRKIGTRPEIFEILASCAIGQINTNKGDDIVIVSRHGYVLAFDRTGELLWYIDVLKELGGVRELSLKYASPVLVDLNNDDLLDVIVCALNGYIIGINGFDGKILWSYLLEAPDLVVSTPAVADIDKDGIPDIVIGTKPTGTLYILDGKNGKVLFKSNSFGYPITSSPVIGDLDSDNLIDILAINDYGEILVFRTNTKIERNKIIWPMEGLNTSRTNALYYRAPNVSPLQMKLLIYGTVIFVLLVVNGLIFLKGRKRLKMFKA